MAVPKKRLLIIEDEPGVASLLKKVCLSLNQSFQFQVDSVPKLGAGLEHLQNEDYDLIFLDLNLPDSKGYDTFHKIHSAASEIPIVVISGAGDEVTSERVVEEGAEAYLRKDELDITTLADTLHNVLTPTSSQ